MKLRIVGFIVEETDPDEPAEPVVPEDMLELLAEVPLEVVVEADPDLELAIAPPAAAIPPLLVALLLDAPPLEAPPMAPPDAPPVPCP